MGLLGRRGGGGARRRGTRALIEVVLLRRIYHVPELFQLLATFALVLSSTTRHCGCGPGGSARPRAPGFRGAVDLLGRRFPSYDLFLIAMGPLVLVLLHLAMARTRFGRLVRAATQDREMVGALGVNQALLFTAVFTAGSFLSGLGGALQLAREPANLAMDLTVIGDAFVVVVVGGMGSIPGAYSGRRHHRGDQGAVHQHRGGPPRWLRHQFLQAHVGGGIHRHGGGADRASTRAARRHPIASRAVAGVEEPLRPASRLLKAAAAILLVGLVALAALHTSSPYTLVLAPTC